MKNRKSGFTLIELLVVLAIVTIISSITFGAFRSISDGNKRTSCQSNLSQVYKSVRLYAQDFDGKFPYLNPLKNTSDDPTVVPNNTDYVASIKTNTPDNTPAGGIGLWSLYTFRIPDTLNGSFINQEDDKICPNNDVNLPLADGGAGTPGNPLSTGLSGYVRSPKIFHCPADRFERTVQYRPTPGAACVATTNKINNAQMSNVDNLDPQIIRLNPSYLSYQTNDDSIAIPAVTPRITYSSFRRTDTGAATPNRQLTSFETDNGAGATSIIERPTDQTTVIAWCKFHRPFDKDGITRATSRNFDNVLFSDGSVQSLPVEQPVIEQSANATNGSSNNCTGWQRVRREKAESVKSAADCTP